MPASGLARRASPMDYFISGLAAAQHERLARDEPYERDKQWRESSSRI